MEKHTQEVHNQHYLKSYQIGRILLSKSVINVIIAVKHFTEKKWFLKIIDRGPYLVGFPAMLIIDLLGMHFHPAKVSSLFFSL